MTTGSPCAPPGAHSADLLAILARSTRRLADEARNASHVDAAVDVLAQVEDEAAVTWRSPQDGKPTVHGGERSSRAVAGR